MQNSSPFSPSYLRQSCSSAVHFFDLCGFFPSLIALEVHTKNQSGLGYVHG